MPAPVRFRPNSAFTFAVLTISVCLVLAPSHLSFGAPDKDLSNDVCGRAALALAAGDTLGALGILDRALKLDSKDCHALVARGQIYLARGEGMKALNDFRWATAAEEEPVRLAAWLGMSRTRRLALHDLYHADQDCRKGLSIKGDDLPLLFEKALIGFKYGGVDGARLAGTYLTRVIEIDPLYCGAYRIWRDSLLAYPADDQSRVHRGLERFLAEHPDSARWWVDIAWDEFLAGRTDSALAVLEHQKSVRPDFECTDRQLLFARCRLEQEDSLGFQQHYEKALDIAVERDEDTRAFAETEVILTDTSVPRWVACRNNRDRAAFVRWYWLDLDDDPIEPLNRRLIEHYNRLRYAELNFLLRNPHSFYQQSENYNRLVTRQSPNYDYDPDQLRRQSNILRLDPRGVVYVRMGPPGKREPHYDAGSIAAQTDISLKEPPKKKMLWSGGIDTSIKPSPRSRYLESPVVGANCEYWYYGKLSLLFVDQEGAGDYVYIPQQDEPFVPRMSSLLNHEYWIDPKVNYTLEYYMAQFLAGNSFDNEVEFYQDDWLPKGQRPTATIALYDSLWGEIAMQRGQVFRVREGRDKDLWLAVHRITVFPGKYHYTIRMASADEKWLGKGALDFAPFAVDSLALSAVVLGVEPQEGQESPAYLDHRIIPRPSTRFGKGEPVTVYYEIYGLQPDSAGRRHYKEWIDVVRLKDGESRVKKYAGKVYQLLTFNLGEPQTRIDQSFERQADWKRDRAPEMFTLDTEGLEPGSYRLVIQLRDNVSQLWDVEEVFFDITGSAEQALNR